MKIISHFIPVLTLFMLSACSEEKKDAVHSRSPDGAIELSVSGKRESPVSPWVTRVSAKGVNLNGHILFEFYGSELSEKTIQFRWEGNEKCTGTFTERDGTLRIFEFTPQGAEMLW